MRIVALLFIFYTIAGCEKPIREAHAPATGPAVVHPSRPA